MDRPADNDDDSLYEYLVDSGVLNDVKTVAESVVSLSSSASRTAADVDGPADSDARRIADRLLEQNADDVERALDAIVRNMRLATEPGQLVDYRWPRLLDVRPGQPPRKTLRNLNALVRLPFTYDTYTGAYFRQLTKGLEQTVVVDAFFEPTVRVYAKLVDTAPDMESAVESFGSLCEATHLRCLRQDVGKAVACVCLLTRCLSAVCKRGAGTKNAKAAVFEFVATVGADPGKYNSPYAILCCADPTARWFDRVSKCYSSRSAFFACLDGDRRLLNAVVSSFFHWMVDPDIPKTVSETDAVVDYACSLHAIHLLAKMFKYRSATAMFPVKVSRTVKIHAVGVANYCLGYLAANRDGVPSTLATGLCKLVAAVATFHADHVIDAVVGNVSRFGVRILAEVVAQPAAFRAMIEREDAADELFKKKRRRDGADMESLVRIATALSGRHEQIWRLITRRMPFLEAVAASGDAHGRCLMANIRRTPLGAFTYDLGDNGRSDDVDWLDPRQTQLFGVACASDRGRDWLNRIDAFASIDRFVESRLDEAKTVWDPGDGKCLDSVVGVAYSYCASAEGLKILLDNGDDGSGRSTLAELYHLSYERFDDSRFEIGRDVLVMLWLRLIEVATNAFSQRVHVDSKLKYRETLSKLAAENRTEDGTVFVVETTGLLTKLQRPVSAGAREPVRSALSAAELSSNVPAADRRHCPVGVWLRRARAVVVRSDQISGTEMIDAIISFGRRRFDDQLDSSVADSRRFVDQSLTDFDVTGIRLALRYGSTAGLPEPEDSAAELERLYGSVERRGAPGSFNCAICTLFIASQGSRNKSVEAYAVLLKLDETTRFVWPPAPSAADEDAADRRAAFGHLVEGLLRRELPEVYNAFTMSGVSWWLLCSGWASDCFWGRLGWPEVCRWMCLVALFPADYQAFFFVCLAAARKRRWLEAFNSGRFREAVHQEDFGDFRLADHADYLEDLAKRHRRSLSKALVAEFDKS